MILPRLIRRAGGVAGIPARAVDTDAGVATFTREEVPSDLSRSPRAGGGLVLRERARHRRERSGRKSSGGTERSQKNWPKALRVNSSGSSRKRQTEVRVNGTASRRTLPLACSCEGPSLSSRHGSLLAHSRAIRGVHESGRSGAHLIDPPALFVERASSSKPTSARSTTSRASASSPAARPSASPARPSAPDYARPSASRP